MRLFAHAKGTLLALLVVWLTGVGAAAQDFSALARVDAEPSELRDTWRGMDVDLYLSQPVPWRVFTLDDPRRLVLDFKEVDWSGVENDALNQSDKVAGLRFGGLRPGWSRMIVDLSLPVEVQTAEMQVDPVDGTARLQLVLTDTTPERFTALAGLPAGSDWVFEMATAAPSRPDPETDGALVVVIDPGHGGLDPGAEHGGVQEAQIMMTLARELAAGLTRLEGVRPVLTRSDDVFVPLQERLTLARNAGAGLFISLHADALEGPQATGASVYTLTDEASEGASQRIAERHAGGDVLAGIDLSGQTDEVALVLQDLVRVETAAAADRFAAQLVQGLGDTNASLNARPRREAALAVLNAADFPSVLLEVGFLSNADDRARLLSPQGRAKIVEGVTLAVARWMIQEAALAPLVRQ